jgi:MULE transposase domain/SWIM zinc finger
MLEASPLGQAKMTLNICDYLGASSMWCGVFVRFCSTTYELNKSGMDKLRTDVETAARESGLEIVLRTSSEKLIGKGRECMSLVCSCSRLHSPTTTQVHNHENDEDDKENAKIGTKQEATGHKITVLHNARKANRKGGKSAVRKRDTKRRTDSTEPRCPFLLPIYSDEQGFYIKGGNGCPLHCYHHRLNPSLPRSCPSRLLLPDDRQFINDANKARAGHTANRNLFYVRGGIFLSVDQCRKICDTNSKSSGNDEDYDVSKVFKDFFEETKANCFFLYHKQSGLSSELHDGASRQVTTISLDPTSCNFSDEDMRRTQLYATKSRCGLGIQATQDLMLALAWILPWERRQFGLFPFVIHLDSTNATNREQRPLFTITGRDSHGKQYTVLRALIPNECSWIFKWLFQTVMPQLLGQSALNRVVLAITYGDYNEITQLDDAIRRCIPNAVRGRCIWHIIDRGMLNARYYPAFHTRQRKGNEDFTRYESLKFMVRRWIWSWAENYCETEDEFQLSKALFCVYMKKKEVGLMLDPTGKSSDDAVEMVLYFLRSHVEPHEQHFAFHLRRNILAFEANSNSAHEGTNHGLKAHSSATNPQQSIHETAKTLCFQAEVKEQTTKNCLVRKEGSRKLWSTLPTADQLTDFGEGLLLEQWKAGQKHYKINGPCENKWLLLFDHRQGQPNNVPERLPNVIPKFWRVRVVERCERSKTLTCSCCYFERVGIPCRHILKVMCTVLGEGFSGVTENDVRVFWRKRYYSCAIGVGAEQDNAVLHEKYMRLLDNDTRGPCLHVDLDTIPVLVDNDVVMKSKLSVHDRCFNFTKEVCLQVLPQNAFSSAPANLTQESIFHDNDDDWDLPDIEPMDSQDDLPEGFAYGAVNPICQALINMLSANQTRERVDRAIERLYDVVSETAKDIGCEPPAGQVVSSCLAKSKRRRTHGTDHWKK